MESNSLTLGVIYGLPLGYATSIENRGLVDHLSARRVVEIVPPDLSRKAGLNVARAAWNLLAPLRPGFQPDVVIYGNDGLASLDLLRCAKPRARTIVVWYDAAADLAERRPSPRQVVEYLRYRNIAVADAVLTHNDTLVDLAKRIRSGRNGVHYIAGGVDVEWFNPARWNGVRIRKRYGIPGDAIVVGYVGRIGRIINDKVAGQPLLEATVRVHGTACGQHVRYLFVTYGTGMPAFRDFAAQLPSRDQFVFTGKIPHREVAAHLAACDICVDTLDDLFLSHARNEVKVREYVAMGRAVIATRIGENVKQLDYGRAGVLVGVKPDEIAAAIIHLVENPSLRRELGARARQVAVERHDWQIVGAQVNEIVRRVTAS